MTATRAVSRARTPMSWLTQTSAIPVSRLRSSRRSRIPAWVETSRPVVGSSRSRSLGRQVSAIAIATRCSCPPESSCG
ncbi:MAG: hypothetical protein B7Z31_10840 [Rhodobacterales bacterium 12-65-15]|nr:MAG: hypothetical protein B7Z31_10840 [Rhodobacterales bacterium 12-65-15]